MPRIVLCKTPSSDGNGSDGYTKAFESAGYQVRYLPVLQEEFRLAELRRTLQGVGDWEAVVISSKRGAEAYVQAVAGLDKVDQDSNVMRNWNEVQLFTVGTSSLEHLAAHQERLPSPYRLDASSAIQAKSATELLPLILAHPAGKVGRILVLRGDKSMESLQDGLRETSRTYTELTVYETSARPTLQRDISAILAQHDEGGSMWLVFFSPSSAEIVIRTLTSTSGPQDRERGEQTNDPQEVCELEERRKEVLWTRFRVAAIGETTARYLVDRKISVEAVAKEPTAQGLLEAIQDNKSMRGDQREDTHRYRFK